MTNKQSWGDNLEEIYDLYLSKSDPTEDDYETGLKIFTKVVSQLLTSKSEQMEREREICICSAVIAKDGTIVRGHRHGDCMIAIDRMGKKVGREQGFITSKNRYVGREEGRKLQELAGIKSADKDGYRYNTLFSEDLY